MISWDINIFNYMFSDSEKLCCYFQVTYAFCKEFISLLLENVGAGGELPTIDVLVKLFQKVCCLYCDEICFCNISELN
jgi:hypothetical protein